MRAEGTHFDISAKDVWGTALKKGKWPWSNVPVFYMAEQNLDMRIFCLAAALYKGYPIFAAKTCMSWGVESECSREFCLMLYRNWVWHSTAHSFRCIPRGLDAQNSGLAQLAVYLPVWRNKKPFWETLHTCSL